MNQKKSFDFGEIISAEEFRNFPSSVDLDDITDDEIKELLNLAGYWVQDYCEQPILEQPWTEMRVGGGSDTFLTTFRPEGLFEILQYDRLLVKTTLDNSDFLVKPEEYSIINKESYFFDGYTYEVKYKTGCRLSLLPKKVKTATFLCAANFINKRDYVGMRSVKVDVIVVNFRYEPDPIPENAKPLLRDWKCKFLIR